MKHLLTGERVATGAPLSAYLKVDGACVGGQEGHLASNGKPSDMITLAPAVQYSNCGSEKLSGAISSFTLKPGPGQTAIMTAKAKIHEFVEPWCVFTLPKTFSTPPASETLSEGGSATTTLDKSASFGSCPTTRAVEVAFTITDSEGIPLLAEVVG